VHFVNLAASAWNDDKDLARRDFLKGLQRHSAERRAQTHFRCVEIANAAPIAVPMVDKLAIRVLVDSSFDQFLPSRNRPMAYRSRRRREEPISARRCTMSGACR
jgi:hypothetical protein